MRGLMQDSALTLAIVLDRAATVHPRKHIATRMSRGVRTRTYADVVERATRLAQALRDLGVRPGDRVATFAWNSDRHVELYLAVPCMGAVLHTLNPRLHPEEVAYIVKHAADDVVFVDASLLPAWRKISGVAPRHVVVMDDLDGEDTRPDEAQGDSDRGDGAQTADYEALVASGDASFPWPRLDETAAAAMCYTSGTTGVPKGVVYSHRSTVLHSMACLFADSIGLRERDVCLPVVPQFHANAWGLPYAALLAGATLAMPGRFTADPHGLAELCETERVTVAGGVPTVWFGVLQAIRSGTLDPTKLASLERITVGGSALPEALLRAFDDLGIRMIHSWGMTETSPVATTATIKSTLAADDVARARLTQGIPLPGLRVRIIDDAGQEAAWDGATLGELQVTGPWVADAYYDPSAPHQRGGLDRFVTGADGTRWLRTGDVATIDTEGYVTLVDRSKDLVKSGGEWISSVHLENLLMAHPGVAEAAVIAIPHPRWDERPLACVVRGDEALTAADLRAYLAEHVPSWQVPDEVVFIDEVPKTSVGKFDKRRLREKFAQ